MGKARIGLIQVLQRAEDGYRERTEKLLLAARACFEEGADLVFFPEAYQHVPDRTIVCEPARLVGTAEKWKARCAALAREYHAYLVPWDYEYADGKVYNASYILDREGREIGRFRKVHMTHSEQMRGITGGDGFPVFELDFGKVGIMICWDNYFPESAQCLANAGAELILYPLYGDTVIPGWELKARARAVDHSLYVAASQIDSGNRGASTALIDPTGEMICRLDRAAAAQVVVEVELGKPVITHTMGAGSPYSENIRMMLDRCRRPDAYGAIVAEPHRACWEEIFLGNEPKFK